MIDLNVLGWNQNWAGEQDHRQLKAPRLKLRAAMEGRQGDRVFSVDLRIRRPNNNAGLDTTSLHSIEHFLLEGFSRLLPINFVGVGIMGCQTGFYLTFLNEGRARVLCQILAQVLEGVIKADKVPYRDIKLCGDYKNHNLGMAQELAKEILADREYWLEAL